MGFLEWKNGEDMVTYSYFSDQVGDNKTLGNNILLNLTEVRNASNPNMRIFTSTATLNNIMEDTTLSCEDGGSTESHTVQIKSKLWF